MLEHPAPKHTKRYAQAVCQRCWQVWFWMWFDYWGQSYTSSHNKEKKETLHRKLLKDRCCALQSTRT